MSYPPDFNYYQPQADPRAPARRAGVLMSILGAIILVSGFCCAGVGSMVPRLMQERPEFARMIQSVPELTPERLQAIYLGFGILSIVVGMAIVVLGRFIARGGTGAVITGIVICGTMGVILLLMLVSVMLAGPAQPPAQRFMGALMLLVPLVLIFFLLRDLFRAAARSRSAPRADSYGGQYGPYGQQQQLYQAGPYVPPAPPPGYWAPPTAQSREPPVPPPPPAPPPPESPT